MSTNTLRAKDIKRNWHLVDAKGKILGRLATEVAQHLTGKKKANFVPYLDNGDNVVVINAETVKVTGKKETQKVYFRHSGYPGGDRRQTLSEVREEKPERVIEHAVKGMLPHTKLGRTMIKKLHVYKGAEHPYQRQISGKEEVKEQIVVEEVKDATE